MLSKLSAEPEGYAECYPGFEEMNDALEDSDDEADYSKMDLVKKEMTTFMQSHFLFLSFYRETKKGQSVDGTLIPLKNMAII